MNESKKNAVLNIISGVRFRKKLARLTIILAVFAKILKT